MLFMARLFPESQKKEVQRNRLELEYLPATIEILETPPSASWRWLMLMICFVFIAAALLSWFGYVDIEATAEGRVIPAGHVKTISSISLGMVDRVLVGNGDHVTQGQLLVKLNDRKLVSEMNQVKSSLLLTKLNFLRTRLFLRWLAAGTRQGKRPHMLGMIRSPLLLMPMLKSLFIQAQNHLNCECSLFMSNEHSMLNEIKTKQSSIRVIESEISKYSELRPFFEEQEKNTLQLLKKGHSSKTDWLSVKEKQVHASQQLEVFHRKSQEAESVLDEAVSLKEKSYFETMNQKYQQANQLQREITDFNSTLIRLQESLRDCFIRSSVDGVIHNIEPMTRGTVVETAKPLMTIVPDKELLRAEVMVLNKDIGFIRPGMSVDVKIETYPYTFYGSLEGIVEQISKDSVTLEGVGLVYPTLVKLFGNTLEVNGVRESILHGMSVTADIKIGRRRVIEFFLEPFLRYKDQSLTVR